MIVERDKLAKEARERLLRNNLRPMAKWLRRQDNLNALLLAELIEEGKITIRLSRSEIASYRHLMVGEYIASKVRSGWTATAAIADAVSTHGVSERDAQRAMEVWTKLGGHDIRTALTFLMSSPKQTQTGGDGETLGD